VPGWDEAVDLSMDPSEVPDPATTPVPDELRAEIEAAMAKYPDSRSAALPALAAAQRFHGWCSPEAIEQATAGDEDIQVKHFECLGACDIAPMASIDGVYVGPIELAEVDELIDDIRNERPPLPRKQLKTRPSADTLPLDPQRATPAPPTSYGEDS
jgi:NADH:ubiquinone oxidoreductase subunit E